MRKFLLVFVAAALLAVSLITGGAALAAEKEVPETPKVRWALELSGNILVTLAKERGYFEEVGIEVEEIPFATGGVQAVRNNQVDIASNYGTNLPIFSIAAGDPITIFGGFMLTGCMSVIAREGTEWHGIEDIVGKKFADTVAHFRYATGARLQEKGYDPVKDVEWIQIENHSDRIAAVAKGDADYSILTTGRMYQALNTPGVKIITYQSDIMPNYSCCRMVARDDFVRDNPVTLKLIMKALLRALSYFNAHREECVSIMAKQLDTSEEYVAAYMLNEHYRLSVDPIKKIVEDNWNYLASVGMPGGTETNINLDDHINTTLYEQALKEATEEYGHEAPQFYADALAFFKANN